LLFNRADFSIGIQPGGVATGDFNGDGALDVCFFPSIMTLLNIRLIRVW
jgi:hypothetical protein